MQPPALIDNLRVIETPEGIELRLRLAGPLIRGIAWVIDLGIRVAIAFVLVTALAFTGVTGIGLAFILIFSLVFLYPMLFEALNHGRTPGKQLMKIAAVHDDGTPLGWGSALVRNLLRAVDIMPGMYGFALASMLVHPEFKRLGDLAAGTVVVHSDAHEASRALPNGVAIPPPVRLTAEEQRTVIALAERGPTMSAERAIELSDLASPLTGTHGAAGAARVLAIARWMNGATGSTPTAADAPGSDNDLAFSDASTTRVLATPTEPGRPSEPAP